MQDQHVYPAWEAELHTTTGRECDCRPEVAHLCQECDHDPACYRCRGTGLVPYTVPDPSQVAVITHAAFTPQPTGGSRP